MGIEKQTIQLHHKNEKKKSKITFLGMQLTTTKNVLNYNQ
jgi:hypothetical protein